MGPLTDSGQMSLHLHHHPLAAVLRTVSSGTPLRMMVVLLLLIGSMLRGSCTSFYSDWAATNFNDAPAQSGQWDDPDHDGERNTIEFAFGTDPRMPDGITGLVIPRSGTPNGRTGRFDVEVLERAGHQPGVQLDLLLSRDQTNWFRPWWLRVMIHSQPADPPGSVREFFSTWLPGTNVWFVRASATVFEPGPEAARYYVATNGSDSNRGTNITQPFATLAKAASLVVPGDLIYLRGGVYSNAARIRLTRSGSPERPIRVRAYPGELPVLDFTAESFAWTNYGISISGSWWQLHRLEVAGSGGPGISVTGHSNLLERCLAHHCRSVGISISSTASNNVVLNCDSWRNFDFDTGTNSTHGENADGFNAATSIGPGNVFRGCRSWENSDDGWDFWQATNSVLLENCWAFRNGTNSVNDPGFSGDGNGFKLGGNYFAGAHVVRNCVAFANYLNGFDQNNNLAGQTLDNNTAWANCIRNFALNHGTNLTPHVLRNNLSFGGVISDAFRAGSLLTNNSWQILSAAGTNDVLSLDSAYALGNRRDDGSLPETPFLRPIPAGRLVNKGVNVGKPFNGPSPELGAFETQAW